MSYPLGRSLTTRVLVRRERWPGGYDVKYVPLVRAGEQVQPDQPVLRLEQAPAVEMFPNVPRLSLPTSEAQSLPGVTDSQERVPDEDLAAGLRGKVVGVTARGSVVIESQVAIVAGMMGAGRQVAGPLMVWRAPEATREPPPILPGAILVVPGPLNLALLRQAAISGIAGVVASSIPSRDLEGFLHTSLVDLLHCSNPALALTYLPPLTVLLTEGLGTLAMPDRTLDLLSKYQGTTVLLAGMTSVRARVYPELVISLPTRETESGQPAGRPDMELVPGALVRVCSGNYKGAIGELNYLFANQQLFPSGIRARAARVCLEDGSHLVVPLPVLERIG